MISHSKLLLKAHMLLNVDDSVVCAHLFMLTMSRIVWIYAR